jgi:hypothetical protein
VKQDRKALIDAYKERKAAAGVYGVTCAATGRRWVGSAANLATIWNRLSFTLRQGGGPRPSLQADWRAHGPESFGFEILEQVDAEKLVYGRDRVLRERVDYWRERLGAEAI